MVNSMTTFTSSSTSARREAVSRYTVDVFGVAWPRYKAEAVLTALVVFALGAILTVAVGGSSLAPAVLIAAASGTAAWWAARFFHGS